MNSEEFHKPFIKSLVIVAIVTIFAMVSSRYVVDYYMKDSPAQQKSIEYSAYKSYNSSESTVE